MTAADDLIADDLIRPFQIEGIGIRGRLVRLGPAIDDILCRHGYPDKVSHILGQAVALSAALAGALKFDGLFTLQTKGDGPVPVLVADFRSPGELRGYAQFAPDALAALDDDPEPPSVPRLLGAGHIAFTVDQGPDTDRYQGIVALEGRTLADCAHNYFRSSEQIETAIRLTAGRVPGGADHGQWRAGAIMLQRLPEGDPSLLARGAEAERDAASEDDWRRAVVLLASARDDELLDRALPADDLLFRLFHEDGVRAFAPVPLAAGCRCSTERADSVLRRLPVEELRELAVAGELEMTCEFCNAHYAFPLDRYL
ncbi:MAG: Hsp33 family molecular chaperone HslO [Alphaproteobacteria bacterium]|jgi:molecular chaperone Hsp33|nr:Hsp33 family molecular chaperone HslO [Alphaproteobacteria bacterium]MDP6813054.1 Hsp33 family molecular chaperone HslO [Alphaproteobacteria bacterium]